MITMEKYRNVIDKASIKKLPQNTIHTFLSLVKVYMSMLLSLAFFEEVSGESLNHNIAQVYFKLKTYQSLGFPSLTEKINVGGPVINLTTRTENHNINENQNMLSVSFDDVRKKIEAMSALPEGDLEEIQSKIDELESIVKSKDTRNKKWSAAKEIIKWVADKGVDVGIAILPLLLNIN